MFLENKYSKWYFSIIEKSKDSNRKKLKRNHKDYVYYESHHVIPKSFGGNEKVLLTAKEHFICHLLLCRMLEGTNKHKMINALIKMSFSKSKGQERYTSRTFSLVRKLIAQKNSETFKGKKKTEKTRNNMKGRSGAYKRTKEHIISSSMAQKKRFQNSPGTFTGKKFTEEMKIKRNKTRKERGIIPSFTGKGTKWYNDGSKSSMQYPDKVDRKIWLYDGRIMKCTQEKIGLEKVVESLVQRREEPVG